MSRHGFNENEKWKELAESMSINNSGENKPDQDKETDFNELVQAGRDMKRMFDAFIEAGFNGAQALRLIAELMERK